MVKPMVRVAEEAVHESRTAPAPAFVPAAPTQNGVSGWSEWIVEALR